MQELEASCNREVLSACSLRGERLAGCGADRGDFCDPAMGCTFRGKEAACSYTTLQLYLGFSSQFARSEEQKNSFSSSKTAQWRGSPWCWRL